MPASSVVGTGEVPATARRWYPDAPRPGFHFYGMRCCGDAELPRRDVSMVSLLRKTRVNVNNQRPTGKT